MRSLRVTAASGVISRLSTRCDLRSEPVRGVAAYTVAHDVPQVTEQFCAGCSPGRFLRELVKFVVRVEAHHGKSDFSSFICYSPRCRETELFDKQETPDDSDQTDT
jgi:hypothetical protein